VNERRFNVAYQDIATNAKAVIEEFSDPITEEFYSLELKLLEAEIAGDDAELTRVCAKLQARSWRALHTGKQWQALSNEEIVRAVLLWESLDDGLDGSPEHPDAQPFIVSGAWAAAVDFCELVEEEVPAGWDHRVKELLEDPRYRRRLEGLQSEAYRLGHH